MPIIKNKSAGPRIFNIKAGGATGYVQHTLLPGQAADLDLLLPIDQDPVLKAWRDVGEIEEASEVVLKVAAFDPKELADAQAKLRETEAEVMRLQGMLRSAELDQDRRAVPRQFGADGGPQQSPTVDGQGGDLTPVQQKHGRPELPPAQAAMAASERHTEAMKRAEQQKAADTQKQAEVLRAAMKKG